MEAEYSENESENESENDSTTEWKGKGNGIGKEYNVEKNDFEIQFENFRKEYPGTKNGFKTEFDNFIKKHKDWQSVIPLLSLALEKQKKWRDEAKKNNMFVPEWAMLQTWINQRRWEEEQGEITKNNQQKTENVKQYEYL